MRLLPPLGADLVEWRLRAGRPSDDALVFPGHDGWPWSPASYKNWHRRMFRSATAAAGLTGARPYDLRHSFVSLLIADGHNVVEVARQACHSPKMALDTYAHVFEEFDPTQRVDAVERIRNAREELRRPARQPNPVRRRLMVYEVDSMRCILCAWSGARTSTSIWTSFSKPRESSEPTERPTRSIRRCGR